MGEHGRFERVDLGGEVAVVQPLASARRLPPGDPEGERTIFAPDVVWDVLPDGTIGYFDSTAYAIHLVGADGMPMGVLTRAPRPEAVTEDIRSATLDHLMAAERRTAERMGALAEFEALP